MFLLIGWRTFVLILHFASSSIINQSSMKIMIHDAALMMMMMENEQLHTCTTFTTHNNSFNIITVVGLITNHTITY